MPTKRPSGPLPDARPYARYIALHRFVLNTAKWRVSEPENGATTVRARVSLKGFAETIRRTILALYLKTSRSQLAGHFV
jgi:hypothetical protein